MNEESEPRDMMNQVQRIFEERGKKPLEMARNTVLKEKIESKEVQDALHYFMTEYWHDVARPALLSLVCEAVGGDPDVTVPIAIPMSLISGAIDIHDDIIDQSKTKGERFTVFGKFGKNIALLVGDALIFKGFNTLYEAVEQGVSAQKIAVVTNIIKQTFFELGDAEALEIQFRGRTDVSPEEYILTVRKKAADVEAHTRISAMLGDASQEQIQTLGEYGRLLGMLIILRDEMIDILDQEELVHRIRKEHLPLPLIYALQDSKIKSQFYKIVENNELTAEDYQKVLSMVVNAGGFDFVDVVMQKLVSEAIEKVKNVKKNRNYLIVVSKGMLLPDWRSFLAPPISNR
jgi:geranylgeranyl diphosphate synthase type I